MKISSTSKAAGLVIVVLASGMATAIADMQVNLSVKFILDSHGNRPKAYPNEGNDQKEIGTPSDFDKAVAHGNQVLAATGRGYQIVVVEYLDIQPPAPTGQGADYWFDLPARSLSTRRTIEDAALANTATWRWNANTINVYVNNSGSGYCSFVGDGQAIVLGDPIFGIGTVIHEVGHIFNLRHTHAGDSDCMGGVNPLADGDGLPETIPDDNCRNNRDELSQGYYSRNYSALTQAEQDFVNTSWLNVMSYHEENILLPAQMDIWTLNALGARRGLCSRRTWYVANGGSDGASGDNEGSPFATISRAMASASTSVGPLSDVVVLRTGSFSAPSGGVLNTPCTLQASGGSVTVHYP